MFVKAKDVHLILNIFFKVIEGCAWLFGTVTLKYLTSLVFGIADDVSSIFRISGWYLSKTLSSLIFDFDILLIYFPEFPEFVLQKWKRDCIFAFSFIMYYHVGMLLPKFAKPQISLLLS